ncbi:tRNA nucleotidyltransferase [Methylosinus sp. Ce-a6]|uniref:tRNA nucleotidyltransferase n=1 Tax=Methylosinus sp. Ce-a6 TaxID=2172005 RepID=UPI001FCF0C2B|nr:tRNA nucleotidyltransferase [Methylosinus sp. Ce-a6]
MPSEPFFEPEFGQTDPGLGLLRMAALLAETEADPGEETLSLLAEQVENGGLAGLAPADIWPELLLGLSGPAPGKAFRVLRICGALRAILPEVDALFGVPQMSDGQTEVDLGAHMLRSLDEAGRIDAPLAVRFALLVMNVGKGDSPREHLPHHYKHIDRGGPRIEAIAARFGAPADCLPLALMALCECERVHRVAEVRAGPVAQMLERLGAFEAPETFARLMMVCACDFSAHAGRSGAAYPKAALLETARAACAAIPEPATAEARAEAIALAFRSLRWSSGAD